MHKHLSKLALLALSCASSGAHAEIVVIVSPEHPAATMTAEQVANVYLGKEAGFAALDLPESSGVRAEFYKQVTGKDAAQIKAMWARLIFTGKAQPPKQVGSDADAVRQVAGNAKAIAYVDKSAVDGSVKPVLTLK